MATRERPDGRQARWARHNEARRRVILDAALDVLERLDASDEVHVQQIADRAGLGRTVVYRHFADRSDLDLAVQRRIFEDLGVLMVASLSFEGTPVEIIRRMVAVYVGWAAEHPALHRFAEREVAGTGESPKDEAIALIADAIAGLINGVVEGLGVELTDDDRAALDPLTFGIVGLAFAVVRRWLGRPVLEPPVPVLVGQLTEAIWFQVGGLAGSRGVEIDPDVPLEDLVADPAHTVDTAVASAVPAGEGEA